MIKILYDDEQQLEEGLTALFERAAALAAEREKLGASDCEVSLFFAEPEEIRQMNREYRGIDEPTDVLSFPMQTEGDVPSVLLSPTFRTEGTSPSVSDSRLPAADPVPAAPVMLGDIVICRDIAEEQAEEFGHSSEREKAFLFTHGLLHLLGYDHQTEGDEPSVLPSPTLRTEGTSPSVLCSMREAEKEIMEGLEI